MYYNIIPLKKYNTYTLESQILLVYLSSIYEEQTVVTPSLNFNKIQPDIDVTKTYFLILEVDSMTFRGRKVDKNIWNMEN